MELVSRFVSFICFFSTFHLLLFSLFSFSLVSSFMNSHMVLLDHVPLFIQNVDFEMTHRIWCSSVRKDFRVSCACELLYAHGCGELEDAS